MRLNAAKVVRLLVQRRDTQRSNDEPTYAYRPIPKIRVKVRRAEAFSHEKKNASKLGSGKMFLHDSVSLHAFSLLENSHKLRIKFSSCVDCFEPAMNYIFKYATNNAPLK